MSVDGNRFKSLQGQDRGRAQGEISGSKQPRRRKKRMTRRKRAHRKTGKRRLVSCKLRSNSAVVVSLCNVKFEAEYHVHSSERIDPVICSLPIRPAESISNYAARVQQYIEQITSVVQTSDEAEQWELAIDRVLLDPLKEMIDELGRVNVDRSAHLLSTISKVEAGVTQDSLHYATLSSLITQTSVTVSDTQLIGGNAASVAEAADGDQTLQSVRLGVEEEVAGKGGGGSSGRDSTIGGPISSPVQSEERRQQSEETREVEAAVTGGESIVPRKILQHY